LHSHVRTHSGEKPYICLKCKTFFSRSDVLKRHINSGICTESTDCKDDSVMTTGEKQFPMYKNLDRFF
jgi:uncharacterized Zn-finger protein